MLSPSIGYDKLAELLGGLMTASPQLPIAFACLDESGKFADTEVVSIAACTAVSSTMHELTSKWSERLCRDGLPYTSMKDAMFLDGPYRSWRPETEEITKKRDALVWDLANLIADAPMRRLVATVKSKDFRELSFVDKKRMGNDPHYAAFESCVVGSLNGHRYNLLIQADLSEEYSEKCLKLFHKIRRRRPEAKTGVVGITFSDDTAMPGLQIADMVSYCARADATRDTVTPHPTVDRIIYLFNSQDHDNRRAFYKESGNGLGEVEIE